MAVKTFRVKELSYINNQIRQEGDLVTFETDPKKGGMEPGDHLEEVSEKEAKAPAA